MNIFSVIENRNIFYTVSSNYFYTSILYFDKERDISFDEILYEHNQFASAIES